VKVDDTNTSNLKVGVLHTIVDLSEENEPRRTIKRTSSITFDVIAQSRSLLTDEEEPISVDMTNSKNFKWSYTCSLAQSSFK